MKYAFKKMRRMRLYDIASGMHKATLNDFKSAKFTGDQETQYAEGADGAKLAAFDLNKVAGFEGTNGAIDSGYLAIQVGGEQVEVSGGNDIMLRAELKTEDGTKVVLPHKAHGATGNEIGYIYAVDVNGMPGKAYAQGATVSATVFAYDPENNEVTLPTGIFKAGDAVIIDYCPKFNKYNLINNEADKFSGTYRVVVDAWFTDICNETDVPLQVIMEKGKVSGAIDLSFGDQAAVQNVKIESMTSSCAGAGKTLWKLYDYDESEIVDS